MRCECGCGWEGEDDVTQWCIEEASLIAFDRFQEAQLAAEGAAREAEQAARRKPGEITDPVMQEAMRRAKEIHAQTFGGAG